VQLALDLEQAALAARLVLVEHARAQVGVDRQLLARHRIEREACRDLGHALGALGDDDELHHGDDQEHHQADHQITAGDQRAEGFDDMAALGIEQDRARDRDRQRQPEERGQQQHAREAGERHRRRNIDGQQQQAEADRDVERDQRIDCHHRQWQDHHADDRHRRERQHDVAVTAAFAWRGADRRREEVRDQLAHGPTHPCRSLQPD
jgi:hypothetical protein